MTEKKKDNKITIKGVIVTNETRALFRKKKKKNCKNRRLIYFVRIHFTVQRMKHLFNKIFRL